MNRELAGPALVVGVLLIIGLVAWWFDRRAKKARIATVLENKRAHRQTTQYAREA